MMGSLMRDGLPAITFAQGWQQMGPATDDLMKAVTDGEIRHRHHPRCVGVSRMPWW